MIPLKRGEDDEISNDGIADFILDCKAEVRLEVALLVTLEIVDLTVDTALVKTPAVADLI